MSGRLITDRIVNNLLLLHVIDLTNRLGQLEDTLKLQKLSFLIQKEFVKRKWRGLNYNFFRWQQGPFSADLNGDLEVLRHVGLVHKRWPITLTKAGLELLKSCREIHEDNDDFMKIIDNVISKFANYSPDKIKEYVYNLRMFIPRIRETKRIKDILPGTLLLFRMTTKRSIHRFKIDENWQATLELAFDQEAIESLKIAYRAAIEGRIS